MNPGHHIYVVIHGEGPIFDLLDQPVDLVLGSVFVSVVRPSYCNLNKRHMLDMCSPLKLSSCPGSEAKSAYAFDNHAVRRAVSI